MRPDPRLPPRLRAKVRNQQMNILFIGDVFASPGRRIVADHLDDIIRTNAIDLAIANAENAAGGFGITPSIAEELLGMGLDVLTSGNHIWDKREILDYLPRQPRLLRPGNYPEGPGCGMVTVRARNGQRGDSFVPRTPSSRPQSRGSCRPGWLSMLLSGTPSRRCGSWPCSCHPS